ncbi:DMP19 family protein [Vibrio mimicus]
MAQNYPDSFDTVSDRVDSIGFDALSEKEQAIYTIWWLEAEVNNGGFHQYFWNSAGDNAAVALKSLKDIGATQTASLLQQAINIAFNGKLPESREDRQIQLEVEEESKFEKLGELDFEFYEYSENFYELLDAYVAE